ncbi:sigma-70 family RNA polymerase sigma factor, partial [bacterium]|nr:sigma-70 family RNA polymerase sigma factor [bacterium]
IARLQGYLLLIANGQMRENLQAKFGASDIVQNSLLDAHSGIDDFKGSTEAEMRAWLKQIVMHNLADEGRRYTSTQSRNVNRERSLEAITTPLKTSGSGIGKAIQSESDKQMLAKAVNSLTARQQRVVEGRHRFGYSYKEIAEQLGITEVAARKIWSRALEQLRAFCAKED